MKTFEHSPAPPPGGEGETPPTGKRKYTKGPAFLARYSGGKKLEPSLNSVTAYGKEEYWRGYRQAVLDGAPK